MLEYEFNIIKQAELDLYPIFLKVSEDVYIDETELKEIISKIEKLESKLKSPNAIKYLYIMKKGFIETLNTNKN